MEFACTRCNHSVKFALERISKASLQLSPHQSSAPSRGVGILDGLICDAAASEDRENVPLACGVHEVNSTRGTLVTAVPLSNVGRFGNGERRADDGECGSGLDIAITRSEEAKKLSQLRCFHPLHFFLLSGHLPTS